MQPHPSTAEQKLALPHRITLDSSVARLGLHELWRFEVGTSIREVAHHPGSAAVFIHCWDGAVHALEQTNGRHLWSRQVPVRKGSPCRAWATSFGLVLQHSRESLQFHDGATGALLWNQHSAGAIRFHQETPGGLLLIERIAPAGSIYPSILVAIEPLTGVERWRLDQGGYPGTPAFGADGNLYVADNRRFRCIEPSTGRCLWSVTSPPNTVEVSFSPDGLVLFEVLTSEQRLELVAMRRRRMRIPGLWEGRVVWRRTLPGLVEQVRATSQGLYVKGRLDPEGPPVLERLDADTGRTLWRLELQENFVLSRLLLQGAVVGIPADSSFTLVDRGTGAVLWSFCVPFSGRLQHVRWLEDQLLAAFRMEGRTYLRWLDSGTGRQKAETHVQPCRVRFGIETLLRICGSLVVASRVDADSRPARRPLTGLAC